MKSTFAEIYLDANATTPVAPLALEAALHAMQAGFGNCSSTHSAGLQARAVLQRARTAAARVLGAGNGQLIFTSGATEAIQTAVLSALISLRQTQAPSDRPLLLYGATEHKAVPTALIHWNQILSLNCRIEAIPVDRDGRHDLDFLRLHGPDAGLICTMAANNETGVISDLAAIEQILVGFAQRPLWLVDSVQALGKLPLNLAHSRIDYATFSGHKLYAPKGIGLLYVREGTALTPLVVGGGQESGARAGTENMAGIAGFGAIFEALEAGTLIASGTQLQAFNKALIVALSQAFPGLVFNARPELSLPTTLNFSVPGTDSSELLNLFDAAGIRVSAGSACSSARAEPSYVLRAMGRPDAIAASAIRLSFGPATTAEAIEAACARIKACGDALRRQRDSVVGTARDVKRCRSEPAYGSAEQSLARSPAITNVDQSIDIEPGALQALIDSQSQPILIDVREPYEHDFSPWRIDDASVLNLPLNQLEQRVVECIELREARPLICFCRSGARGRLAAQRLRGLGYLNTWNLAGGLALLA